ncbi:isopenicillin N synthase family oxygenase [Sphingobium sp. 10 DY56-G10]|nr:MULTISPECIES: isopenicillin N synthase family oxygenase [Pseudomonadota]MDG2514495.1 isopenicillin N synthase family oxygenase [Sphingobium yanoikuyae]
MTVTQLPDPVLQRTNEFTSAEAVSTSQLPFLDLSLLYGSQEDRQQLVGELREILFDHGFFYLRGHGVRPDLISQALTASRMFFALPREAKLEIDIVKSAQFRGYTRIGGELTGGRQDWREQVDFDREEDFAEIGPDTPAWKRTIGPNQWPSAMPSLKPIITTYQAEVTRVAIDLLKAIALALGQPEGAFEPLYKSAPRQHLKIVRYPGRDVARSEQGVGAHKDGGLVTILLQDSTEGLRVQRQDGSWVEAPPIPGTFVVNTGELLELATDGFVRADVHAAVTPPSGIVRYSIPFFLGASHEGHIPLIDLPPELKAVARGVSSDPANPLFRSVGENHLKARIRSHPDVARAHYGDLIDPDAATSAKATQTHGVNDV